MNALPDRIAGAPISWGVCEVPGWGWQPNSVSPVLDDAGWQVLLTNLDQIALVASAGAITATLHPHVGTMVESGADVHRVLAGSSIGLCLDTGHLLIGGVDPVALAAEHAGRIRHTHLKDVDATWARRVQSGEVTYTEVVRQGMYRPLGQGDVDITAIVGSLEAAGYDGWYVLEQDTILAGPPMPNDPGPIADAVASIEHLRAIAGSLP